MLGNFPSGSFPPPYPTHGHGDQYRFVWCVGDVPVLVDSGRYRYTPDGVSVMQKGALGHSVPLVNGFPPVANRCCATVLARPYAAATLELSVDGTCVRMAHDGFAGATPVRFHARRLCTGTAGLKVDDRFDRAETVAVQLRWNFGPGFGCLTRSCSVAGDDGLVRMSVSGFLVAPVFRVRRSGRLRRLVFGNVWNGSALVLEVEGRISMPASIMTEFRDCPCAGIAGILRFDGRPGSRLP